MNKKELIEKMVNNYYLQLEIVGGVSELTLEEYLKGIFKHSPNEYTEADLQYGLSLRRK